MHWTADQTSTLLAFSDLIHQDVTTIFQILTFKPTIHYTCLREGFYTLKVTTSGQKVVWCDLFLYSNITPIWTPISSFWFLDSRMFTVKGGQLTVRIFLFLPHFKQNRIFLFWCTYILELRHSSTGRSSKIVAACRNIVPGWISAHTLPWR